MSAESPTGFDQLLAQVRARADAADAAGLLDAAVAVSAGHAAAADRLLDHFVAHARGTGMSWTDIGARLGVSKQAARQRFADPAPTGCAALRRPSRASSTDLPGSGRTPGAGRRRRRGGHPA